MIVDFWFAPKAKIFFLLLFSKFKAVGAKPLAFLIFVILLSTICITVSSLAFKISLLKSRTKSTIFDSFSIISSFVVMIGSSFKFALVATIGLFKYLKIKWCNPV